MLPGSEITILILKSSPRFIFITSGLKLISNNPSSKIVIFSTSSMQSSLIIYWIV